MKRENWQKVEQLLVAAYDLESAERQKFIEEISPEELRREVVSLLEFEKELDGFLDASAITYSPEFFEENAEEISLAGETIGNYRIEREIGRGGMGAVYLARRSDGEYEQKVALKLLRREVNSKEIRRRFVYEKRILASLNHPNIAHLLDAGTTADGIPFLAMEYVEGVPVDRYCEREKLGLRERLKIFQKVCEAVSFAHRKLVVHRDLKPSNILVKADGEPKLLDFGISKLLTTEEENEDARTITKLGAMTPEYASPEQIKGETVSTATDVYSLGVVLYELLTGRRPFETNGNAAEFFKATTESDPKPPSAITNYELRITNEKQNPKSQILNPKSLRGDLDNIILKSLKKEPERRYLSVEQFSEDIRRHLAGLPVAARPDTFFYRASKFAKRHKYGVLASALIFLAILGGALATFRQAKIAEAERDRARLEAHKAERINVFLQNMLNFSVPNWLSLNPERNRTATLADAVDEAAKNLEADFAGEPEILAEVQMTLGMTYVGQGRYAEGERLLRASYENFRQTLGEENPKTMQAAVVLADAVNAAGNYAEAENLYRKSVGFFRRADESQTRWLAIALNGLGVVVSTKGNTAEAERLYREALERGAKLGGKDRWIYAITLQNLGMAKRESGDLDAALKLLGEAKTEFEKLSTEPHFANAAVLLNIGTILKMRGEAGAAADYFQKSREQFTKTAGENHPYSAAALAHLADVSYLGGDFRDAHEKIKQALEIQRKTLPENHVQTGFSKYVLGKILTKTGETGKGETVLRGARSIYGKNLGEKHYLTAMTEIALAENLAAQNKTGEAKKMLVETGRNLAEAVGENHPFTIECRKLLAEI